MAESAELMQPSDDAGDASWVPKVDMEFKSDEEAYHFYNNYAKIVGFSVRKAWINRRSSGVIISRTYVCYKEGYQGNKKDENEVKKPRKDERTGCLAHMIVKITENGWYRVSEFHPMHNHDLVPLPNPYVLKPHKTLKKKARTIVTFPSQKAMFEYLVRQAGGYRQVTFVSVEEAATESWAPKVDMEFENDEKAYHFYADYGRRVGFDVRKAWVNRKPSGVIISRTYVCFKEGFYGNKNDGNQSEKKRSHPSGRTGCHARMIIKLGKNGRYRVTEFQPIHNHELATAKTAHLLKSHKLGTKAKPAVKNLVNNSKVGPKASRECVGGQDGAQQGDPSCQSNMPARCKDTMKVGDAGAVLQYMQEKQAEDPSFYYAIQLDEEDHIRNVFWADGKSIVDYNYFGDVICFDMTYKASDYGRPFAPFYGVNNHRKIVFFGAALLYDDETEESFKWLFQMFKTVMHGKQPRVVLTDKTEVIRNAIASVWQDTTHHTCLWHIYHNATTYLRQLFQGSRSFAHDFSQCIYDCEEEEEFISSWEKMLEKYEIKDNAWLKRTFEDREKWAVPYSREIFSADMKNVQRKVNLNNTLKEYLSPERDLLPFFKDYESIMDVHRHAELQADFSTTQSTSLLAPSRMLRQASNAYTPAVFDIFQREFEMSMDCMVYKCGEVETVYEYKVTTEGNPKENMVEFNALNGTIVCSCKKFEFMGIQCRHVLKTLDILNIKELPPQYLLKRWRKDAKAGFLRDNHRFATDGDSISFRTKRSSSLCRIFGIIAARAAETVEGYTLIENLSDQLMDHVSQVLKTRPPEESQFS